MLRAVLQKADAATLCQLKAVSAAWCTHARRELALVAAQPFAQLCKRLCRYGRGACTLGATDSLN